MLCEKCHKNQATVHIVKVINGDKKEINICQNCAQESEDLKFSQDLISPFSFQNILSGFMDYMDKTSENNSHTETRCPKCGMSAAEFKRLGLLGCHQCYKTFSSTVDPIVRRVQGKLEHRGKVPDKAGKDILEKKRLVKLKEELQQAILAEEYEKAAVIRDEIKNIQNSQD
ncbi:UvrB/UvrC motif-containing protein [Clostridium polynesiense]|uniref:UvrB/UvrC motif-containing protein n=1 Tax=Clostridium polynesiense TaxID=1325933 RepID=UPI00058C2C78|nr:UvrB/UvrC motif-containing protein [Clostridium polynesiense]